MRSIYESLKLFKSSLDDCPVALREKEVEAPDGLKLKEVPPYIDQVGEVITGDPHCGEAKSLYVGLSLEAPPAHIVFTDIKPTSRVNLVDYSKNNDMGVVKWMDNGTLYVSTRRKGVKIIFPETVTFMFNHFGEWEIENTTTQSIDFTNADLSETTDVGSFINNLSAIASIDLSGKDSSLATNASGFISNCKNLQSVNVKGIKLEKVQYAAGMFERNPKLEELDLSDLTTGGVWELSNVFRGDTELRSVDLSNLNHSNTNSFNETFKDCPNLTTIYTDEWHKNNSWSSGTDTFSGCTSLPGFDESQVGIDKAVWKENGGYFTNPGDKG